VSLPSSHGVTGTRVGACLVVSVATDLSAGTMEHLRGITLQGIEREGATSAVIDLTAVPFLDLHEFDEVRKIIRMGALLGARVMLAGLRPGIVAHLMAANADVSGVHACLGLEEALHALGARAHA
jgi:rsbT antagonist protein RsbS